MVLHTLNAAPSSAAFGDCLRLAGPNDCILLLGDGVYGAIAGSAARERLTALEARICLLEPDAEAAGVRPRIGNITLVDYDGFVALSEEFPRQMAWY